MKNKTKQSTFPEGKLYQNNLPYYNLNLKISTDKLFLHKAVFLCTLKTNKT